MRVFLNFVKTYGRVRFHRLLTLLAQGISGQIADEFNVSRERVRQWKNTLERLLPLSIIPEIDTILRERKLAWFVSIFHEFN